MPRKARPKKLPEFRPFADDAAVRTFGALSFENGTERIAVHGDLDLTRDRQGLERAKALRAVLDAIVAALEAEDLPDSVAEATQAPKSVKNPFA